MNWILPMVMVLGLVTVKADSSSVRKDLVTRLDWFTDFFNKHGDDFEKKLNIFVYGKSEKDLRNKAEIRSLWSQAKRIKIDKNKIKMKELGPAQVLEDEGGIFACGYSDSYDVPIDSINGNPVASAVVRCSKGLGYFSSSNAKDKKAFCEDRVKLVQRELIDDADCTLSEVAIITSGHGTDGTHSNR